MKPWLVLDTSMPHAVVAVVLGVEVLGAHVLSEQKRHAEGLVDALDRTLLAASVTLDGIAGVGVGRGPGSFIGIRTGIAFAKGLVLGRGVPLVGVPSLLAVAASAEGLDGDGVVATDAKRGELFVQRVRIAHGSATALGPARPVPTVDALAAFEAARFVVGNATLPSAVGALEPARTEVRLDGPTPLGLARALADRLALPGPLGERIDETESLVPDYQREADAKLPLVDPAARRSELLPR